MKKLFKRLFCDNKDSLLADELAILKEKLSCLDECMMKLIPSKYKVDDEIWFRYENQVHGHLSGKVFAIQRKMSPSSGIFTVYFVKLSDSSSELISVNEWDIAEPQKP